MHEINGKRMNRYHELGQYAFGEALSSLLFSRYIMLGLLSGTVLCALQKSCHPWISAGQRAGLWAVIPFQLIVMVGLGVSSCWILSSLLTGQLLNSHLNSDNCW